MRINASNIISEDKTLKRRGLSEPARIGVAAIHLHQIRIPRNYTRGTDLHIDLIFDGRQQNGEREFRELCVRVATWIIENDEELHKKTDKELLTQVIPWEDNFGDWARQLYSSDDMPW